MNEITSSPLRWPAGCKRNESARLISAKRARTLRKKRFAFKWWRVRWLPPHRRPANQRYRKRRTIQAMRMRIKMQSLIHDLLNNPQPRTEKTK